MKTMILFFALLVFDVLLINASIYLFENYHLVISIPSTLVFLGAIVMVTIKYLKYTNNNNYGNENEENENKD